MHLTIALPNNLLTVICFGNLISFKLRVRETGFEKLCKDWLKQGGMHVKHAWFQLC